MKKLKITVEGKVYDVIVEETDGNAVTQPQIQQENIMEAAPVSDASEEASVVAPKVEIKPETLSGVAVKSPMPGNLLDLKVAVGDKITKGKVVAVLEAMKMENEITSPCAGTVKAILIKTGVMVKPDDVIMVIDEGGAE